MDKSLVISAVRRGHALCAVFKIGKLLLMKRKNGFDRYK